MSVIITTSHDVRKKSWWSFSVLWRKKLIVIIISNWLFVYVSRVTTKCAKLSVRLVLKHLLTGGRSQNKKLMEYWLKGCCQYLCLRVHWVLSVVTSHGLILWQCCYKLFAVFKADRWMWTLHRRCYSPSYL